MNSTNVLYYPVFLIGIGIAAAFGVFAHRLAVSVAVFVETRLDLISKRRDVLEALRLRREAGLGVPSTEVAESGIQVEAERPSPGSAVGVKGQWWVKATALLGAAGTFLAGMAAVLAVLLK